MPVYNGEKFLGEAIESILAQTLRDFEFIIVNDGSTDGTSTILASYQQRDSRIRLYHQENRGLIITLNRGLDLARGKYIARMDADDICLPERLATQVAYLDSHPRVGLVSANCYLVDSTGKISSRPLLQHPLNSVQVEWELYWGNPIVHPLVMYRATSVRAYGGYPGGYKYYAEDYALWLRMIADTEVAVLDQPLLYLRKHGQNATLVNLNNHIDETIGVAQVFLADRVGYRPSNRCIRLTRYLPIDDPVSSSDLKQTRELLLQAFQALITRQSREEAHFQDIRVDLVRRLFHLADLFGDCDRGQALVTIWYMLHLSPKVTLSLWKPSLRIVLGLRMMNSLRQVRHRITMR